MKKITTLLAILLFFTGCTEDQILRLEKVSEQAQARVAETEAVIISAENTLDAAEAFAAQVGVEAAKPVIEKADAALTAAWAAHDLAKATAEAAKKSAESARISHNAGQGTIGTVGAFLLALVSGGAALAPLAIRFANTSRALYQTVRGVQVAREALGEAEWKAKVAPHLSSAQDESVKRVVDKSLSEIAAHSVKRGRGR